MFEIIRNEQLAEGIFELVIKAPRIARHHHAGQFCIIRATQHCERVPLSVADKDVPDGTITVVVQVMGHSTQEIVGIQPGEFLLDVVGPLGNPTEIGNPTQAAFVGGGVGVAAGHLVLQALQQSGADVLAIVGVRTRDLVIYEDKFRWRSDELIVTTDDGSYGYHGLVTEPLTQRLEEGEQLDLVITVGPVVMMAAVAQVTRPYKVKTIASLNPIMVDGTGMCGACRVTVGGETKFTCVDGPEFDAHEVDFKEVSERLKMYDAGEERALQAGPHLCKAELNYWQIKERNG